MSDLYGDPIVEEVEEDFKIEKKSSAYFFNAICDKRDVIEENPDLEREYIPFVINKYFSYHQDCVSDANDMNLYPFLSKKMQFDYFINNIRKRKRKLLWENEKVNGDVSLIKEYFKTSLSKAKYIYKLMGIEDMGVIRKRLFKGGLKK
jgi:hypothetical protein